MAFFISTLLFLSVILGGAKPAVSQSSDQSEPMCDWGELGEVLVVEGEVGWLSCPLFSRPSLYNYSAAQSAGHNLIWYRVPAGHDLEEPIERSQRLSKERDRLWLQPAAAEDTGQYICMLRNKSSCAKIAMRLKVLSRDAASEKDCQPPVAVAPSQVVIPLQGGKTLECPDLQDVAKMADSSPRVTWYHRCEAYPFGTRQVVDREQKGSSLVIHMMVTSYQGLYSCTVNYSRGGEPLHYSRSLNVTAVNPIALSKLPFILKPTKAQTFPVRRGGEVRLTCRGVFPYLEDERREIWWTIDGKTVEELADARFSKSPTQQVFYDFGDRTEESLLLIQDIQPEDLKREYNCSVRNPEGFDTRRARLEEEESLQVVPLACGLGVTLLLMLALFVVYHVFWLELLLLYRSWFGTDERYTDDKEFDIYISYARNSEEEQFVLTTLRGVLENELGYSVCIFDRDSLPGGTITDETLSFVARSRRLLVVVSPGYASQGSQALLELKAGIDGMALGGHLRVILVQYRAVRRQGWVRELRRARLALALVRWQGDKSKELTSHFWKRLRVELPVRRVAQGQEGGQEDLTLRKLQSQSSTSSQTGLITNSVKQPHAVLNSAAGL